jgi:uncharacterized glyoxalase superfamily protein PhnB
MPQGAIPMLSYEDCDAAASWLVRAFGFAEVDERYTDESGRLTHVELDTGGGRVMLGWPGPAYQSPRHHAEACREAAAWLDTPYVIDGVHVLVADVDSHSAVAREAGAEILRGPEDAPFGRLYAAADPEGHRWMFLQPAG